MDPPEPTGAGPKGRKGDGLGAQLIETEQMGEQGCVTHPPVHIQPVSQAVTVAPAVARLSMSADRLSVHRSVLLGLPIAAGGQYPEGSNQCRFPDQQIRILPAAQPRYWVDLVGQGRTLDDQGLHARLGKSGQHTGELLGSK